MAEGYEPKPYSPLGFEVKSFQFTTAITTGGSWYSANCAVSGKKLIGIAGFGVDYPGSVYISNITIAYNGTVSLFIVNNSGSNSSGFNFIGLYVNAREV